LVGAAAVAELKLNTRAWARLWVQEGAPALAGQPWQQEHHVITAALARFRKDYLAATNDWERLDVCETYGVSSNGDLELPT
jgi:hypothetical protein